MSAIESEPAARELQAIASECQALSTRLLRIAPVALSNMPAPAPPIGADEVRCYLRARRLRESLLPADLFADPAWDILLDLYASEAEGKTVSISSACIASAVPQTTALRWIGRLEELELVQRRGDARDCRRTFIELTSQARAAIRRWLMQVPWLGLEHQQTSSVIS